MVQIMLSILHPLINVFRGILKVIRIVLSVFIAATS